MVRVLLEERPGAAAQRASHFGRGREPPRAVAEVVVMEDARKPMSDDVHNWWAKLNLALMAACGAVNEAGLEGRSSLLFASSSLFARSLK